MNWRDIPSFGEHDFEGFYEQTVAQAPPGARIVEVGCYHGRSLVHLGLLAKQANKGLEIVGVDWGRGMSNGPTASAIFDNLAAAALLDDVTLVLAPSVQAARLFAPNSCWMVFLDDAHTPHEAVAAGILAWMPAVSHWLAGHDYKWWTVCEPVNNMLDAVEYDTRWENCWKAPKQEPKRDADIHLPTTIPQAQRVL